MKKKRKVYYTDSDLFMTRGIEYRINYPIRNKYKSSDVVELTHQRSPYGMNVNHVVKVRVNDLFKTKWCCPLCDPYSKLNILPKIKDTDYDIKIKCKDGTVLYLAYYSDEYYTRLLKLNKRVKLLRKDAKENNYNFIELRNYKWRNDFNAVIKFIKKHQ